MVDWNEDGLIDLLVGEFGGKVSYYRNIGSPGNPRLTFDGFLTCAGQIINVYNNSCPWVDDWDEDGRKDLLVGSSDGRVRYYLNVGTNANPVFEQTNYLTLWDGDTLTAGSRCAPVVVDLNGDGAKDVVCGQVDGYLYYFENEGSNANPELLNYEFLKTGTIGIDVGATSRPAPLDWNGDGAIDLIVGSMDARLRFYVQAESTPPAPSLQVTYTGPFNIPLTGAVLEFSISITNPSSLPMLLDIWSEAKMPDGFFHGPLVSLEQISLYPYESVIHQASQDLPGRASEGLYTYHIYAGDRQRLQAFSEDDFSVYKTNMNSHASAESVECLTDQYADPSNGFEFHVSPNPFNIETTISLELPASGRIQLRLYDTAGRLIGDLINGWREEGFHQVRWKAGDLPTGVYFARLEAEQAISRQKLLLMK